MTFPATDTIVAFIRAYEPRLQAPDTLDRASLLVLDLLGVAVAGSQGDVPEIERVAAMAARPGGTATLLGTGTGADARDAAWFNGFVGHLLEFDDATLNPVGHPTVTIVPALLGLAETRDLSGREFLEAYLVGLEVHSRLGQAKRGNWSHLDPWLPIGHIGLLGAAAACARLLDLSPVAAAHCLGLAAHAASGLNVTNGTLAKALGAGHSARMAVEAAELAEAGFTAAERVIERPGGFAETFLGADEAALEAALVHLGAPSHLEETGIAVKRYPSCYGSHWSIDALRGIFAVHRVTGEEVQHVELIYPADAAFLDDPHPSTVERARFSLQYGLAACLIDGHPQLASFEQSRLRDPEMLRALARVSAAPHPDGTEAPAAWSHDVIVTTTDGRRLTRSVRRPRGHPRDPLDRDEVVAKFLENVRPVLAERAAAVVELAARLDDVQMRELAGEFRLGPDRTLH